MGAALTGDPRVAAFLEACRKGGTTEEAIETARIERTTPTEDYLMGEPQLSDHLEAGMAALGLDATGAEDDLLKF